MRARIKAIGDNVLSKTELEYLKSPEKFGAAYSRVLRHRINAKKAQMRAELKTLESKKGANCNAVTEFRNAGKAQKELGMLKAWWAEPDLNRRPLARKANVLTRLDDRPTDCLILRLHWLILELCFCAMCVYLNLALKRPLKR